MKAFVITIMDNYKSVEVARRCIKSCKRYGIDVEHFEAITPRHKDFESLIERFEVPRENFVNKWSRTDNAIACFLSMATLWEYSVLNNEDVLILEHDAIMTGRLPALLPFSKVMTLGKPSYGKYNTPTTLGIGPLTQKPYFGGAHAYAVSPQGASELLHNIPEKGKPADVYMNVKDFPWLEEYYPWIFEVNDTFSTIQKVEGCFAKHNYRDGKLGVIDA